MVMLGRLKNFTENGKVRLAVGNGRCDEGLQGIPRAKGEIVIETPRISFCGKKKIDGFVAMDI